MVETVGSHTETWDPALFWNTDETTINHHTAVNASQHARNEAGHPTEQQ
jgi:hypothetical protein